MVYLRTLSPAMEVHHIYSCSFHNSKVMVQAWMSVNIWLMNLIHSHNGIPFIRKEKLKLRNVQENEWDWKMLHEMRWPRLKKLNSAHSPSYSEISSGFHTACSFLGVRVHQGQEGREGRLREAAEHIWSEIGRRNSRGRKPKEGKLEGHTGYRGGLEVTQH